MHALPAELLALLARAPVTTGESTRIRELIWGEDCYDSNDMYRVFLMSEHWQKFKASALSLVGKDCECCWFGSYTALRHFTYDRMAPRR